MVELPMTLKQATGWQPAAQRRTETYNGWRITKGNYSFPQFLTPVFSRYVNYDDAISTGYGHGQGVGENMLKSSAAAVLDIAGITAAAMAGLLIGDRIAGGNTLAFDVTALITGLVAKGVINIPENALINKLHKVEQ